MFNLCLICVENLGYYDDGEEHLGTGESKYDGEFMVLND